MTRWTHHGPLISDFIPKLKSLFNDDPDKAIALASPACNEGRRYEDVNYY